MVKHTIELDGPEAHGARVSIHVLRVLSTALLNTAQRALRLRVEGRSNLQGKAAWLDAATDFQLVGLRDKCTVLEWEAPTLEEAAPEIFAQLPLWDSAPPRDLSSFSLVEETLRDAVQGNAESDILDRGVLDAVAAFRRVLDLGFDALSLNGMPTGAPVTLTRQSLETAECLRKSSPPTERVIISGWLDQLTWSDRAFRLRLSSGQSVRGLLPPERTDFYATLWGKKVTVDGEARFKPSGTLSLVIAGNIQDAVASDTVWEQMPCPRMHAVAGARPETPTPEATGIDRVFGQWPGDETDEEILNALEKIS